MSGNRRMLTHKQRVMDIERVCTLSTSSKPYFCSASLCSVHCCAPTTVLPPPLWQLMHFDEKISVPLRSAKAGAAMLLAALLLDSHLRRCREQFL